MKIVIAGAGDVGFHLAELLAFEQRDIVLIDSNQDVLDYAATHLDVMTLRGDASSIEILEQAQVSRAELVLAVTTSEKTNLLTAILAKKMGARQTIARVKTMDYLEDEQRKMFEELGVDALIAPSQLAAEEIQRLIGQCSFTDIYEFEEGRISLIGLTLGETSLLINVKLSELHRIDPEATVRPIAILRGHQTIIPNGETILLRNDHIYFITDKEDIDTLVNMVGKKKVKVKNIMILGGTDLAVATAKLLENNFNVTLVERDKDHCKYLSEILNHTLVINGEPSNFDLLVEEGLDNMDAVIALTNNSEANIIASLTAKNHGVYKTIAQVENKEYTHISQNIGVDTLINKKLIAANNIFRYVRKGQVAAVTSINGVDAEVIEFVVHKENQLTRKALKDLHFPKSALVGGVIRGKESLIPDGNFRFQVDDKVIVFALPEAIAKVENLFR
ncbi:MAG: Trk system potassium transporter TrkA [Saprospiraceae bacterium]|nr:Trk system potassium transporter TrkA [Saprospiraceae bacterium]MDZ4704867.1 Trk system potassium transporter TrkA [Saprospiraceae bacterium]